MRHVFVGVAFMMLALFVGVAFVYELSGSGFGVDSPEFHDQDEVVFRDRETVTVDITNDPELLLGKAAQRDPRNLLPEWVPSWEHKNLDEDGYYHYTVRPYDTLSGIARIYLGKADLWKLLLEHNGEIQDPREIYEGMTLKIPLWLRDG